jgi:hypothetical protein
VDVNRSIYLAPYFSDLTSYEILEVRKVFEDQGEADGGWNVLQTHLFGHLVHGQEEYLETAYVLRQTFRTNSTRTITKAASQINQVCKPDNATGPDFPNLSSKLKAQIDSLPDGEWLKRPTQVRYIGKEGTDVAMEFQWAPKWSVVYGGTFTGLPLE